MQKNQQDQSQIKWIFDFIWNIADDRLRPGTCAVSTADGTAADWGAPPTAWLRAAFISLTFKESGL